MKLSHFKFKLPEDLIAQYPSENRDECRMMVVNVKDGTIEHKIFKLKAQGTAVVGNGRDIIKSFLQSFVKKPLIRILLYLKQIGHLQDLFLPRIAHAHNLGTGNWTYSVFLH